MINNPIDVRDSITSGEILQATEMFTHKEFPPLDPHISLLIKRFGNTEFSFLQNLSSVARSKNSPTDFLNSIIEELVLIARKNQMAIPELNKPYALGSDTYLVKAINSQTPVDRDIEPFLYDIKCLMGRLLQFYGKEFETPKSVTEKN